ncbi:sterol carrier family protein [Micrococcus sp. 2A]|uniref:sterol carrier family protein n=1 Tax=Micrococcus sp. 2A TaxID=3142261 RepID=UPI0031BB87AC
MTAGSVPRRRVPVVEGHAALTAWARAHDEDPAAAAALPRSTRAMAVRFALEELATRVPGNSVEVRVPPFGVAQCLPGPRHTRGTPPNAVEMDAVTWLSLATGLTAWGAAVESGAVRASGVRADLAGHLPLIRP